jgi:hypothetical protein
MNNSEMIHRFNWQYNNCYHLVNRERQKLGLKPLPKVDYGCFMSEYDLPYGFIKGELEKNCDIIYQPRDGDLVLLDFNMIECLGMVLNEDVVYMNGLGRCQKPIDRLNQWVKGFYRVKLI